MKIEIKVGDLVQLTRHIDDEHWPLGHVFIVQKIADGYPIDVLYGFTALEVLDTVRITECQLGESERNEDLYDEANTYKEEYPNTIDSEDNELALSECCQEAKDLGHNYCGECGDEVEGN